MQNDYKRNPTETMSSLACGAAERAGKGECASSLRLGAAQPLDHPSDYRDYDLK